MEHIDLSPAAIQAHLDNGARMRALAVKSTFTGIGNTISGVARSIKGALVGDWTGGRTA
ncbi:MAG: hypothetical protein ACPGFA_13900 [Pikeienuella sp.]